MSAFRAKGEAAFTFKVPRADGSWVNRGGKTKDSVTAKRIQQMLEDMGPKGERAFDVLAYVTDGDLSLAALYDLYRSEKKDLANVRAKLDDVDLEPRVKEWEKNPGGKVKGESDSAKHYVHHVRALIGEGERFPRSRFTARVIQRHIEEMDASNGTKRKAGAAFSSFGAWLTRRGIITANPARDVELPPAGAPRVLFLETADAIRLADKQPSPYRELSALLAGSGIEVSVALALRVRDVDKKAREIRARGTKTHSRDRIVRVAEWAWGYVEKLTKGKLPDAKLFDGITDRWRAQDQHVLAVASLEFQFPIYTGYTMRDARHTFAVRAIRAGTPAEVVAQQMGHANSVLIGKVYGRFKPNMGDRDRWERQAAERDQTHEKEAQK